MEAGQSRWAATGATTATGASAAAAPARLTPAQGASSLRMARLAPGRCACCAGVGVAQVCALFGGGRAAPAASALLLSAWKAEVTRQQAALVCVLSSYQPALPGQIEEGQDTQGAAAY